MFCKNCGKEINDKAAICIHCGCATGNGNPVEELSGESKKTIGKIMGVFLGLIGLIIGICMYPSNSYERKTFIQGWGLGFGVAMGIAVVLYLVLFLGGTCAVLGMTRY